VTLSDPMDYRRLLAKVHLAGQALSASGIHKGPHIIDPRSGKPAKTGIAVWATAQTAADADALSTAFMVMSVDRIRAFCRANADTSAVLIHSGGRKNLMRFGRWDNADFCCR